MPYGRPKSELTSNLNTTLVWVANENEWGHAKFELVQTRQFSVSIAVQHYQRLPLQGDIKVLSGRLDLASLTKTAFEWFL